MRDANGNKVEASRRLGISRMQLYGRLRKYGLETRPAHAPDTDDAHSALVRLCQIAELLREFASDHF